jgi:hypothetical protein
MHDLSYHALSYCPMSWGQGLWVEHGGGDWGAGGRRGAGLTWDSCVDVIYLPLPTGFFWYGELC